MSETALVPYSGQVIDLADPAACAVALREIRDWEQKARDAKSLLIEALVEEARRQGTQTLHLGLPTPVKLFRDSDTIWDIQALRDGLRAVGLPEERLNALIVSEISYRVDGNVARQLAGVNDEYKRVIEACRVKVEKGWRAS